MIVSGAGKLSDVSLVLEFKNWGRKPSHIRWQTREFMDRKLRAPGRQPPLLLPLTSGLVGGPVGVVKFPPEGLEPVVQDRLADVLHQPQDEVQVVYAGQAQAQYLPGLEQVPEIGSGEVLAGIALAVLFQGRVLLGESAVGNVYPAGAGEEGAVVGSTQSNISTPWDTPSTRSSGEPTPIR